MTNGDVVRAMTDQELATLMCQGRECTIDACPGFEMCRAGDGKANGLLKWLRKPLPAIKDDGNKTESGLLEEE
jgi:hypothetical protein